MKPTVIGQAISLLLVFFSVACNRQSEVRLTPQEIAEIKVPRRTQPGRLQYRETAALSAERRFIKNEFHRDDDLLLTISYPQIEGALDRITSLVNKRIWKLAVKGCEAEIKPSKKQKLHSEQEYEWQLSRRYSLEFLNDEIVSLVFHEWWYGKGAAHGDGKFQTLTVNLKTGGPIQLRELFKPGVNYMEQLHKRCNKALSSQTGFEFLETLPLEPERYKEWHLTEESLCIDFARCEPIPCSAGEQIVAIPYAELRDILNLDGVLKSVVAQ